VGGEVSKSTPEGRVKEKVKEVLANFCVVPASKAGAFPGAAEGWYYMPVQGSSFGVRGIPDFIGQYLGVFFGVETKAPGKKPTGFQSLQIKAIRQSGGACFVVDGEESLQEFEEFLNHIREGCDE
jgi:hypothetical protein